MFGDSDIKLPLVISLIIHSLLLIVFSYIVFTPVEEEELISINLVELIDTSIPQLEESTLVATQPEKPEAEEIPESSTSEERISAIPEVVTEKEVTEAKVSSEKVEPLSEIGGVEGRIPPPIETNIVPEEGEIAQAQVKPEVSVKEGSTFPAAKVPTVIKEELKEKSALELSREEVAAPQPSLPSVAVKSASQGGGEELAPKKGETITESIVRVITKKLSEIGIAPTVSEKKLSSDETSVAKLETPLEVGAREVSSEIRESSASEEVEKGLGVKGEEVSPVVTSQEVDKRESAVVPSGAKTPNVIISKEEVPVVSLPKAKDEKGLSERGEVLKKPQKEAEKIESSEGSKVDVIGSAIPEEKVSEERRVPEKVGGPAVIKGEIGGKGTEEASDVSEDIVLEKPQKVKEVGKEEISAPQKIETEIGEPLVSGRKQIEEKIIQPKASPVLREIEEAQERKTEEVEALKRGEDIEKPQGNEVVPSEEEERYGKEEVSELEVVKVISGPEELPKKEVLSELDITPQVKDEGGEVQKETKGEAEEERIATVHKKPREEEVVEQKISSKMEEVEPPSRREVTEPTVSKEIPNDQWMTKGMIIKQGKDERQGVIVVSQKEAPTMKISSSIEEAGDVKSGGKTAPIIEESSRRTEKFEDSGEIIPKEEIAKASQILSVIEEGQKEIVAIPISERKATKEPIQERIDLKASEKKEQISAPEKGAPIIEERRETLIVPEKSEPEKKEAMEMGETPRKGKLEEIVSSKERPKITIELGKPKVKSDFYPAFVRPVAIEYPQWAQEEGIEGAMELTVLVGSDGKVMEVNISRTSGHKKLDLVAVEALQQAQFTSYETQYIVKILIKFTLGG